MACQMFDLECMVYMVKVSYHQKPYRRSMMQLWGANVIPSPSDQTNAGRAVLADDPESPGSLGIAISEAVEDAVTHPDTKYALGQRAQPRAAAPDGHRRRGAAADARTPTPIPTS